MTAPGPGRRSGATRDELLVAATFMVSFAAAVALAVVYWIDAGPRWEGALLAVAAAALAAGLVMWSHRLMPPGPEVEDRPLLAAEPAETARLDADLDPGRTISRRGFVVGSLGAALAAFAAALVFPVRSLGPRPTAAQLDGSPWHAGSRLVTADGRAVLASDVPLGGLVTVFPEGAADSERGQAVLVRVEPELLRPRRGREGWTPDGLVAYSKVCTHAGCPVGLYEQGSHQLLCPCHQSTFDVLDGARPVFGPAAVSLPQLPLSISADGHVVATGGFSDAPGPSYWNRSR